MPEQQTPYDIILPPGIAYVPGALAWSIVATIFLILLLVLIFLARRQRRPFSTSESFAFALRELSRMQSQGSASHTLTRLELNDLSLLLRRLISAITQLALDACTLNELRTAKDLPPCAPVRELMQELLCIEEQRFAPMLQEVSRSESLNRLRQAIDMAQQRTQLTKSTKK